MLAFDLIIGMLFISGFSMICIGLYARRFTGRVPAATPYVLLMISAAAWAILYALELLTIPLPLRVFYHNLRFLFLPFFSVLELWLVIAYVKRTGWLRRDWAAVALIIPITAAILALTSQYHDLFRYNFSVNTSGPVPVLHYSESAFFMLYNLYSFTLLALAIILLMKETRKKGTLWEMQPLLILLAMVIPTILNYTSLAGLTPVAGVNMAPVLLWIPAILYTVALFRYQFLDIVPIARSRLIETLSKPVLVLDTDGRIIDLNPAACSLFSLTLSSALGRPIAEIVPDWPDFLSLCMGGAAQRRDLNRVRDGRVHYYIGSAEPLLTRQGEIEGHLIFLQDITDQKNAEEAVRQKSHDLEVRVRELNCLFKIARLIETSASTDSLLQAIADVIPSAWQYPELTCARIVVDGMGEFRSGKYRECNRKQDADIIVSQKRAGKIEILFLGDVGESGKQPFLTEEADLLHAIAERVGRVIERKRAEEALQEKTEELDQYFSTSLDLFCIADTDGYFRRLNPEWEKSLGYTLPELEGKRFLDFVHPDDLQKTLDAIGDLKSQHEVLNFTNRYRHHDGTYRWIEWRSFPKGDRIFAAARDITDRRRAEEALQMALKKLNMLSSITRHDILNQITGLRVFLDLSREDLKGTPSAALIEKEDQAAEAIQRQIEFTKFYQDIGVNAPQWQDVAADIHAAVAQLNLSEIGINIAITGVEIFADPLIEKVFFNLMENSIRHGERVTRMEFSSRESENGLVLTYRDNGVGISADDKKKLFQKGFGKHIGLGLFLSREILSITGITIAENGVPGEGAQFEMTILAGGFRFKKPDA